MSSAGVMRARDGSYPQLLPCFPTHEGSHAHRSRHPTGKQFTVGLFVGDGTKKIPGIAPIRAKSGHEDEVRKAFTAVVGPSQKEADCLSCHVFEEAYDTGRFFTVEEWTSEEAPEAHVRVNKQALDKQRHCCGKMGVSA